MHYGIIHAIPYFLLHRLMAHFVSIHVGCGSNLPTSTKFGNATLAQPSVVTTFEASAPGTIALALCRPAIKITLRGTTIEYSTKVSDCLRFCARKNIPRRSTLRKHVIGRTGSRTAKFIFSVPLPRSKSESTLVIWSQSFSATSHLNRSITLSVAGERVAEELLVWC